jgi:TonB family protein
MRRFRPVRVALALWLLGPALLPAQEAPLVAGSEGVPVPKAKSIVKPVYPPEALAQGIRGIVILDLVIDEQGRVEDVSIVRSIPGLDEAAVAAARRWQYEPTKVDGRLVKIRLTVPVVFSLRLPDVSRQDGIPELRQGVAPKGPEGTRSGGRAVAEVTLDPDGRIGIARVVEGEEPWSAALLQALRTWRFAPPPEDMSLSFRVAADFAAGRGRDEGHVTLRLEGLHEASLLTSPPGAASANATAPSPAPLAGEAVPEDAAGTGAPSGTDEKSGKAEPAAPGASTPEQAPAAGSPAKVAQAAAAPAATRAGPAAPATAPGPEPAGPGPEPAGPSPAEEPKGAAAAAKPAEAGGAPPPVPSSPAGPAPASGQGAGPAPASSPVPTPGGPGAAPAVGESGATAPGTGAPGTGAPGTAPSEAAATAAPPIEVVTAAPPPLPPENGISAIRGVTLEPGVPDLTQGRRPVAPPLARMAGASGEVQVDFSVGPGGVTTVQEVRGPQILQAAARGAVETWTFRRTRAERLYLTATFTYEGDAARADVHPQALP